jgi:hypothetical protein
MTDLSKYAYCEPAHVTGPAPWCIRPLTEDGPRPSGGVDTASLCGRVTPKMNGWDISGPVSLDDFDVLVDRRTRFGGGRMPVVCQRCVAKILEMK